MPNKTNITKKDLENILGDYDLGEYQNHKSFNLGWVQTNLLLETSKGKFAFRLYKDKKEKAVAFEVEVLNYLKKHSYPSPAPIQNKKGEYIGEYENQFFVIFEFMEGEHVKDLDSVQIAKAFGQLHKITEGYRPKDYRDREDFNSKSCRKWGITNVRKIKARKVAVERYAFLKQELSKIEIPKRLPKGVCHRDTDASNFLFKDNKLSAVLDFDDSGYSWLLYDVANMLYFWAWPNEKEFDFKKAKELLKEYQKYRKLTKEEREHLYDMLRMVICMSIAWFIHDNKDFALEKKRVEDLDEIGRENFYNKIFK